MAGEPVGWLSILPPLIAIGMAIATRQVILSLLAGVWIGWVIAAGGRPIEGTARALDGLVSVFDEPWRVQVLLFTMLVGSLLILVQRSGGIEGFVRWVGRWRWSRSRRGAQLMAWLVGLGVFIESNITCLVVGTVARPLFDELKIPREKLAYVCDSTSAPVCILLPINGWGAMVLGLLAVQAEQGHLGDASPLAVFAAAIPLNFYAILAVLLVLVLILTGRDFGPMRAAERRAREEGKVLRDGAMPVVDAEVITTPPAPGATPRLRNMLVPLATMVVAVPCGIVVTGLASLEPERAEGALGSFDGLVAVLGAASGATAVFWAVSLAVVVAAVLVVAQRILSVDEVVRWSLKGAGGMVPLTTIMALAFAIGMVCDRLGTGEWVAGAVAPHLTPASIAPVAFVVSGFIAFATGTSWGTFAILIPLTVPLAASFNLEQVLVPIPLVVAAVLGGGVFGDHCSPISDTTVVSSLASSSDHIDHVRTQLPYALAAGAAATVLYALAGLF